MKNKNKHGLRLTFLSLTLLLSVVNFGYSQESSNSETIVSGHLKGLDVPYLFIDYTDDKTGDRVWDTIYVKNEKFSYITKINKTKRIAIWPLLARRSKSQAMGKNANVEFLARPGDKIVFKGNVTETFNAIPTGTTLCDDMNAYDKSIIPLNKKIAKIMKPLESLKYNDPKADELYKSLTAKVAPVEVEINTIKKNFIKEHPNSEVAAYYLSGLLTRKTISEEEALELLTNFDDTVMANQYYIEAATRLKAVDATKVGNRVPELVTNTTIDGKEFDLKSLRGKYVLIDFWGTWCGPCIAEMPTVKKYQENYKNNLVVVGINSGDKKQVMIDFITSKGYNWIQLMSKKGNNQNDLVSKFNISGFPTKFIISPEGIILEKHIGSSEDAFVKLDELLGNK
ncbi:TlpA family protein disulfide reductase [Cellulophaga sp. 20_2_10]|uniref:TlpA family protein disulfide reductase n=1 Tax=Cellulophaga sp. 20_2_10 TaxID=2942476 RepID=UPI00201A77F7|nr:TlpA disulfide reductase family protein [Cellulophaga sp. 20_2_10]MCL5246126.1 TlpA family protein disulfide reductase [Cellulophaga sp. 20_2_10]